MVKQISQFLLLLFLSAFAYSTAAQEGGAPAGGIDWNKEWFQFNNNQGVYAPRKVTPLFTRDANGRFVRSSVWGRNTSRTNWWNQSAGNPFGLGDADCNQSTFSTSYNTPPRVPDRIPLEVPANSDPVDTESWFGNYESPKGSALAQILADHAIKEAKECRRAASHRQNAGEMICDANKSKGVCYAAVKDAILAAGIGTTRMEGGSAIDAHRKGYLAKLGFVNVIGSVTPQTAVEGCISVYSGGNGHNHGHIEVKTKVGFCSDYCGAEPLNSSRHRLEAVYCML